MYYFQSSLNILSVVAYYIYIFYDCGVLSVCGKGSGGLGRGEGQPYITLEPTTINHVNAI